MARKTVKKMRKRGSGRRQRTREVIDLSRSDSQPPRRRQRRVREVIDLTGEETAPPPRREIITRREVLLTDLRSRCGDDVVDFLQQDRLDEWTDDELENAIVVPHRQGNFCYKQNSLRAQIARFGYRNPFTNQLFTPLQRVNIDRHLHPVVQFHRRRFSG